MTKVSRPAQLVMSTREQARKFQTMASETDHASSQKTCDHQPRPRNLPEFVHEKMVSKIRSLHLADGGKDVRKTKVAALDVADFEPGTPALPQSSSDFLKDPWPPLRLCTKL